MSSKGNWKRRDESDARRGEENRKWNATTLLQEAWRRGGGKKVTRELLFSVTEDGYSFDAGVGGLCTESSTDVLLIARVSDCMYNVRELPAVGAAPRKGGCWTIEKDRTDSEEHQGTRMFGSCVQTAKWLYSFLFLWFLVQ